MSSISKKTSAVTTCLENNAFVFWVKETLVAKCDEICLLLYPIICGFPQGGGGSVETAILVQPQPFLHPSKLPPITMSSGLQECDVPGFVAVRLWDGGVLYQLALFPFLVVAFISPCLPCFHSYFSPYQILQGRLKFDIAR